MKAVLNLLMTAKRETCCARFVCLFTILIICWQKLTNKSSINICKKAKLKYILK